MPGILKHGHLQGIHERERKTTLDILPKLFPSLRLPSSWDAAEPKDAVAWMRPTMVSWSAVILGKETLMPLLDMVMVYWPRAGILWNHAVALASNSGSSMVKVKGSE